FLDLGGVFDSDGLHVRVAHGVLLDVGHVHPRILALGVKWKTESSLRGVSGLRARGSPLLEVGSVNAGRHGRGSLPIGSPCASSHRRRRALKRTVRGLSGG